MYGFLTQKDRGSLGLAGPWLFYDYWYWTGSRWDWICRSSITDEQAIGAIREFLGVECGAALARSYDDKYVGRQRFRYSSTEKRWELEWFTYVEPFKDFVG